MGEFKSLLRKTSDDYHGPRSLPLVGKFREVSYAPPEEATKRGMGARPSVPAPPRGSSSPGTVDFSHLPSVGSGRVCG